MLKPNLFAKRRATELSIRAGSTSTIFPFAVFSAQIHLSSSGSRRFLPAESHLPPAPQAAAALRRAASAHDGSAKLEGSPRCSAPPGVQAQLSPRSFLALSKKFKSCSQANTKVMHGDIAGMISLSGFLPARADRSLVYAACKPEAPSVGGHCCKSRTFSSAHSMEHMAISVAQSP